MNNISIILYRRWVRILLYVTLFVAFFYLTIFIVFRPSHDRSWELGQEELPRISVDDYGTVEITNFRNFDWNQNEQSTSPRYETRAFTLSELETVDVFISHFDDFEGLAHIFLSFGFGGEEYVVVSLETRREDDEEFSPTLGVLRQFEIIYVVGSEQDIVGVRTDVRGERVYLYPTKATPLQARSLFLKLASDINSIYAEPRIYNTLTNNCTNELTRRVEEISEIKFPFTWKTLLPGYFDEVLYELGIIDNSKEFSIIKTKHHVDNTLVNRYSPTYSSDLRSSVSAD